MSTALPPLLGRCAADTTAAWALTVPRHSVSTQQPAAATGPLPLWHSLALPHPVGEAALQPRKDQEETHQAFLHRVLSAALEAGEALGRFNNLEGWESNCWSDDEEEDENLPVPLRGLAPAAPSTTQPNDSEPTAKAPQ